MGLTKDIGDCGEQAVAEYIKNKGYIISVLNFRTKYGEIDIIAENNDEILFVEVKTRADTYHGRPQEYVNYSKKRRIFITANIYLRFNAFGLTPRFDVAEVLVDRLGNREINYIENAFGAESFNEFKATL